MLMHQSVVDNHQKENVGNPVMLLLEKQTSSVRRMPNATAEWLFWVGWRRTNLTSVCLPLDNSHAIVSIKSNSCSKSQGRSCG